MTEHEWLAERFEEHRARLRAMAHRMLGSAGEADDAVQEVWLRLHRSDAAGVQNLGGWLTTVVGRVCIDMLRSRTARREEPLDAQPPETAEGPPVDGPEHEALLADSLGAALLVVLDTLTPAERLALVLHDMFAVPYREIAPILDRTPSATKMLASRARRRIRAAGAAPDTDPGRKRHVVEAFLAASRDGDFDALLTLLHPDAVLRPDRTAAGMGAREMSGATGIARRLSGHAQAARPALIDGIPAAAWAPGGRLRTVFSFTIADGRITAIDVIADPEHLERLDVQFLTG